MAKLIEKRYSTNGSIEIYDEGDIRALYFGNDAKQSAMSLSVPNSLVLAYTEAMMLGLVFQPKPQRCLVIGLGGGSIAKFLHHHLPETDIDAVELRQDVVDVARQFFCLPDSEKINITIDDAFHYLLEKPHKPRQPYDLIFIDAFNHDGMAKEVKTHEFFDVCRQHLTRNGILAVNLWAHKLDQFPQTMAAIEDVFEDSVLTLPVPDKGNIIAFASAHHQNFKLTDKKGIRDLSQRFELNFSKQLRQLKTHNRWRYFSRLFF